MVHVTVDNFKDKDSFAVYELAEGSSVIDLKTEIEATEGVSIGRQRLVYNNRDLQDNESLDDSSIFNHDISNGFFVRLLPVQICIRFGQHRNEGEFQKDRDIQVQVDLEEPVYSIEQNDDLWYELQIRGGTLDSAKLSVLGSDTTQPTISISDINRSFLSYGIHHNDVINVVCKWKSRTTDDGDMAAPHNVTLGLLQDMSLSSGEVVTVEETTIEVITEKSSIPVETEKSTVHPTIKGLSLKCDALIELIEHDESSQPGWLYGTPIDRSEREPFWHSKKRGYFPGSFVSVVEEHLKGQHEEVTDITKVPPLPPFRFPPAEGRTFRMPIADGGHSFLKLMVDYELAACPITTPTHVTISLLCSTYNNRRVSSVSVMLTIPQNTVIEVKIRENEAHRKEFRSEQEITESRSEEKQFNGLNIGALGTTVDIEGGISKKHSIDDTEKGTKISRRKVDAGILEEDTIFWNLKAPMTKLDEDGLNGKESITFVLKKKPVKFNYECRVTHVRNGVEKTVKRIPRDWPLSQLI
ncbi:hypothetical protein Clacol_004587 [Clathrus columnatus]|uniref:Ubiquitin-like domain-containing protein n=1 Tax=Clathrus columnatus TaxID=1419009 RepID=A0AAV5ABF2_9AGAM|nr:hypothetical protein Clacol_004587 [Clathrus columnatus]